MPSLAAPAAPGSMKAPNHNHIAAVALGACLLDRDLAERVTILTTNYDLGLERAVVGELTPIVGIDDFVPSLSARLPSGKTLQLVKLHGCIERGRLVYAFSQMGRLLFETDRLRGVLAALSAGAGYPSLYLTIGYSFSDPDLRPMFLDAFSRTRPLIYRNERPPDASAGSLSFERQEHLARTGQAILQHEFFTRAMELVEDVRVHHSDLYCKDGSAERISLPVRLARHFGAADLPVSEAVGGQAGGHEPLADAIQQFTEPQVLVFLGGLVDACARSDALGALRVGLAKSPDSNMRGEIIRLYLSQYGHSHRMADAAKECARLGRELQEPDVRLIANAYRSLALSIGPAGPLRARQFWAAVPLLRARFLMNQVDFKWQVYYEHYALHFWTKVREVAAVALSRLPGRFGQWAGRAILRRHARKLEACIKTALELESPDLETAADVQSLLAEVRVHLRDEAVSFAERMRQIRAALGTLNRVALVDRQLGWAYLSEDNDQSRDKAIQAFARGLWLATYSADRSIEPKLGADLVRAVHAGHPEDLEQLHAELPSDEVGAVRDICRSVGVGERSVHDMLSEDCRRMLVRHLRFLYLRPDDSVLELVHPAHRYRALSYVSCA